LATCAFALVFAKLAWREGVFTELVARTMQKLHLIPRFPVRWHGVKAQTLPVVVVLSLVACGGTPRDPVERLIDDISKAAESRDATAVGERLSEDFQGEGGVAKAETIAMVRQYLGGYERVNVDVFDLQRAEAGRVKFRVEFAGKPKEIGGLAALLPSTAVYEFELEFAGEGKDLRVRRASWRPWAAAREASR
jgi:hypothetical protein